MLALLLFCAVARPERGRPGTYPPLASVYVNLTSTGMLTKTTDPESGNAVAQILWISPRPQDTVILQLCAHYRELVNSSLPLQLTFSDGIPIPCANDKMSE
jgi:hypothetical protein